MSSFSACRHNYIDVRRLYISILDGASLLVSFSGVVTPEAERRAAEQITLEPVTLRDHSASAHCIVALDGVVVVLQAASDELLPGMIELRALLRAREIYRPQPSNRPRCLVGCMTLKTVPMRLQRLLVNHTSCRTDLSDSKHYCMGTGETYDELRAVSLCF